LILEYLAFSEVRDGSPTSNDHLSWPIPLLTTLILGLFSQRNRQDPFLPSC
jgi:hypothetical protein